MKKILLLSDTHGYMDDDILKYVKQADEVWHAGDVGNIEVTDAIKDFKPLKAVYGNIDDAKIRTELPEHNKFKCEDVKVWLTHIGGYPPRYNKRLKPLLEQDKPDLFICGHSHILKVIPDKKLNLLHMNPGAVGKHGFHKVRTMLRFTIDGKDIKNLEVIEFNNR
ncbi:MAG: metallophosphoesterase family protein [Winogradskyella sp.]|nr:metallophosphatase family protein [Winogradskyella sp.]MBT8375832.1 metallophosphatase family protein [Bacteroidia bacterium]NNF85304.1 metallophosphoesterase family protein [Winogradskyella sp.]NNK39919.1 metallophosphoesterase family protein [Winogradskyella sp.]NNL83025.1 metallophosphoesterase family protein [Winogradskyella sp.]